MDTPKRARSAKWGQACAPCAAAKTRCIRSRKVREAKCDRCHDLSQDCCDQVQRPRKKRQPNRSKAAELEERLNSLLKALDTSGERDYPIPFSISTRSESGNLAGSRAQDRPNQENLVLDTPVSKFDSSASVSCTCKAPIGKADLAPSESDETLLSIYTNKLCSYFPFVVIPPETTSKQLHETRPFLMKVIRMVASVRYLTAMRGQSRAVFKDICNAMLMKSERSLDLLQGILIFLGFYHYFCMSHAHYNSLVHLALSLMEDLDLNTCPGLKAREEHHRLALVRNEEPQSRTNEERRTLLGVWYMTSNAALVVKQLGPARYTRYIDQCMQELESAAVCETDQLAVQLVRIQHLTEKIFHFHTGDQFSSELTGVPKDGAVEYLVAFQAELDRLRNEIPLNLKTNSLLSCHYCSASLRLFSPLLADAYLVEAVPQPFTSLFQSGLWPRDIFSHFTAALKDWFNYWLAVPVCSYFYLPQPVSTQLIHASRNLVEWVRLCGPTAVKFSSTDNVSPSLFQKDVTILVQSLPSFIGVPPCPVLVAPQTPVSTSDSSYYAQAMLDKLRAEVFAQPQLRVDVLGIAEAMAVRFESAKKEMAAAQGGVWENDMWDAAAEQMRMKKARVEEWCENAVDTVIDRENQPLVNPLDHGEVTAGWWSRSQNFEPQDGQNGLRWASDAFDGIDWESSFLEISGGSSVAQVGDMIPTG